jgi:DNA-binding CsgD family transcriptional regulator
MPGVTNGSGGLVPARHHLVVVDDDRPTIGIELADAGRRLALTYVVAEAGWRPRSDRPTVLVSDRLPIDGAPERPHVLVVRPEPLSSRRALRAFTDGEVQAVVDLEAPDELPVALDQLHLGRSLVSRAVVGAAHAYPPLRPRLEQTLHLVVLGRSNLAIARALHESEATAKRDVAELLRCFDSPSRVALASTGHRLGFRRDPSQVLRGG